MLKEVNFKFKDNSYKVKIDSVGQWLKIEQMKSILTNGRYGDILNNGTVDSLFTLDMIDIQSVFEVVCPEIKDQFKGIESLQDLSFEDAIELRGAYREQIAPYINEIRKMMNPKKENKGE